MRTFRRLLVEPTHGRVQHLVIDPEGEFHTLRETCRAHHDLDQLVWLDGFAGGFVTPPLGVRRQ